MRVSSRFARALLLTFAGCGFAGHAIAADPAQRKPAPVEYVRTCQNPLWQNSGGFIVPGSQTCLRIFGQARFDYRLRQQFFRITSASGYRGTLAMGLDAITPSEFGNVRAFVQMGQAYRTGEQRNATAIRQGFALDGDFGQGPTGAFRGGGAEFLYSGFVQFAGLTAGRTQSFFDPFFVPDIVGTSWRAAPFNVNLIAYTAALGQGFQASVSLEDATTRRLPVLNGTRGRATFSYAPETNPLNPPNPNLIENAALGLPHIVGALNLEQPWGSARLTGVLTNVRLAGLVPATGPLAAVPSTKYGFATMGAVKVNMPMVGRGDNLVLLAGYGEGAVHYSFATFQLGSTAIQSLGGAGFAFGDAAFNNATGQVKLTRHLMMAAGFHHFWSPNLNSSIFGSYRRYDVTFNPVDLRDTHRDGKIWTLGANTIWSPVRGLSFALEAAYVVTDPKGRVPDINHNAAVNSTVILFCNAALSNCRSKSSQQNVMAHFRVIRDF